jgi:hypothetical protein
MVKIKKYQPEDRFVLEKMIKTYYQEKKMTPPENSQILETIAFYSAYPQCGKIIIILYENNIVGYCIAASMWKNKFTKISYYIDELYIDKNFIKHKLEINLIEFLITNEKIYGIYIKYNELNSFTKNLLKSIKFQLDDGKYFYKVIEI